MLTVARLRELLDYDPETGDFIWKSPKSSIVVGAVAGWSDSRGYVYMGVDRRTYKRSRLAWLYMYGEWPREIDHIDGCYSNDRIKNLRLATRSQNGMNRTCQINSHSGIKGVKKYKDRWMARITRERKTIYLGLFSTREQAAAAYQQAARKLHGKFARW